ncbi:MAG: twin-arginine translocase TatA/TatE family subunit [Nitrospinota bacterium]|jgi:TatA/E family protein of Tat protein translocase|nr:twin-arginine translocase TatA/TatE family subunit [Nitrospinota bacterium]|tara:strand:- start:1008 stop:1307 length:300 start_codon:yes stop_codon:yes gene_type:complete
MFGIGFVEIIVILGIALIIIGPKKLPDLAKSLGKGYMEFMRAFREMQKSIEDDVSEIQKTVDDATNLEPLEADTVAEEVAAEEEKKDFNHTKSEVNQKE